MAVSASARVDQEQEQLRQQTNLGLHLLRTSTHNLQFHSLSNLSLENILLNQQNTMLLTHLQLLLLQSFILSTFHCRPRTDSAPGPHLHEFAKGAYLLKLISKAGEGHWHQCLGQGVQPWQLEESGVNKEKNSSFRLDYLQIVQLHLRRNRPINLRKIISSLDPLEPTHDANLPRIHGSSALEIIIFTCWGRVILTEIFESIMPQGRSKRDRIVQQLDFSGDNRIASQQWGQHRVLSVPDKPFPKTSQH